MEEGEVAEVIELDSDTPPPESPTKKGYWPDNDSVISFDDYGLVISDEDEPNESPDAHHPNLSRQTYDVSLPPRTSFSDWKDASMGVLGQTPSAYQRVTRDQVSGPSQFQAPQPLDLNSFELHGRPSFSTVAADFPLYVAAPLPLSPRHSTSGPPQPPQPMPRPSISHIPPSAHVSFSTQRAHPPQPGSTRSDSATQETYLPRPAGLHPDSSYSVPGESYPLWLPPHHCRPQQNMGRRYSVQEGAGPRKKRKKKKKRGKLHQPDKPIHKNTLSRAPTFPEKETRNDDLVSRRDEETGRNTDEELLRIENETEVIPDKPNNDSDLPPVDRREDLRSEGEVDDGVEVSKKCASGDDAALSNDITCERTREGSENDKEAGKREGTFEIASPNSSEEGLSGLRKSKSLDLSALRQLAMRGLKRKRDPSPATDKADTLICDVEYSSDDNNDDSDEPGHAGSEHNEEQAVCQSPNGQEEEAKGMDGEVPKKNASCGGREVKRRKIEAMKKREADLKEQLAVLKVSKCSPFPDFGSGVGISPTPKQHRGTLAVDVQKKTGLQPKGKAAVNVNPSKPKNGASLIVEKRPRMLEADILKQRIAVIEAEKKKRKMLENEASGKCKGTGSAPSIANDRSTLPDKRKTKGTSEREGSSAEKSESNARDSIKTPVLFDRFFNDGKLKESNLRESVSKDRTKSAQSPARLPNESTVISQPSNPKMCLNGLITKSSSKVLSSREAKRLTRYEAAFEMVTRAELAHLRVAVGLEAAKKRVQMLNEALVTAKKEVAQQERELSKAEGTLRVSRATLEKASSESIMEGPDGVGSSMHVRDSLRIPSLPHPQTFPALPKRAVPAWNSPVAESSSKQNSEIHASEYDFKQASALTCRVDSYISPLAILQSYRLRLAAKPVPNLSVYSRTWSHRIDPMKSFCQFELHGSCSNINCDSQHGSHCANVSKADVLRDLAKYFTYRVHVRPLSGEDDPVDECDYLFMKSALMGSIEALNDKSTDPASAAKMLTEKLMVLSKRKRFPLSLQNFVIPDDNGIPP